MAMVCFALSGSRPCWPAFVPCDGGEGGQAEVGGEPEARIQAFDLLPPPVRELIFFSLCGQTLSEHNLS